jgi:hypothetical protein
VKGNEREDNVRRIGSFAAHSMNSDKINRQH